MAQITGAKKAFPVIFLNDLLSASFTQTLKGIFSKYCATFVVLQVIFLSKIISN